jgi:hypothetical protein
MKLSWDATLVKVFILDIKSSNISQAPPREPRPKYLLIFAAVSGSKFVMSEFLLWDDWSHLQMWEGLVVGWLHEGCVNVSGAYGNGACLGSVVLQINSGPE